MRNIDHFIAGAAYASGERQGDVFDPNNGEVQAQVRLGTAAELDAAVDAAARRAARLGRDQPAAPRAGDVRRSSALVEANMDELAALLVVRARQGDRRLRAATSSAASR